MTFLPRALATIAFASAATFAQAGDVYLSGGLPGLQLGYRHAMSDRVALRADLSSLGHWNFNRTESGIDYDGKLKADRVGLFADYFVAGSFRLTGGVTFNNARLDLHGRGNGGTIQIGNTNYTTVPGDSFDVTVKFPRTTPYLGIGWGKPPAAEGRWGFVADLGLSIGKPSVDGRVSGPTLTSAVTQADLDRELQDLRESLKSLKGLPQLSLGVSYKF